MTFDPTTNRVPWGLMTKEERKIMMACTNGWELMGRFESGWHPKRSIEWCRNIVYRAKPAPAPRVEVLIGSYGPNNNPRYHSVLLTHAYDPTLYHFIFRLTHNEDGSDPQVEVVK